MIKLRIQDPDQVPDALGESVRIAGALGRYYVFTVGPFDDKQLAETLTLEIDGADEVEAAEALGQRFIDVGIPFDDIT